MAFCEDCGSPLSEGVVFCENCGAKISSTNNVISNHSKEIVETGIIYTNLSLLAEKLNTSISSLTSVIENFIKSASNRGIGYTLKDVSDSFSTVGSVENHIRIIKSTVQELKPKYLFILGSSNVIPSIIWENKASDCGSDADVSSDLPYATLDTTSPFEGQEYDFEDTLRVGRLPNIDFENYFANLNEGCGKIDTISTFAESAEVWVEETIDIYSHIKSGPNVHTSPEHTTETTKSTISSSGNSNLFLFNLHGSNQTEYWYGQRGGSYPEAVAPDTFDGLEKPYFLAVEACYGAAYEDREIDKSILLSSLSGKCISFLGSSRIAFGTPRAPGSCADVICGEYLKNLKSGMTVGDALEKARRELMKESDAEEIKTLAEFSLYGDPSARIFGEPKPTKTSLFSKNTTQAFSKGIRIPLPNIRKAIRLELTNVEEKIAQIVQESVYKQYADLEGIVPKFFKNQNETDKYHAVFEKSNVIGKKIVSVSFGKNGQIKSIKESK